MNISFTTDELQVLFDEVGMLIGAADECIEEGRPRGDDALLRSIYAKIGAKTTGKTQARRGRMNDSTMFDVERRPVALREDTPLPCALLRDGALCGRPAHVAQAWPSSELGNWPVPGLWTLQPVCPDCLADVMKVYE